MNFSKFFQNAIFKELLGALLRTKKQHKMASFWSLWVHLANHLSYLVSNIGKCSVKEVLFFARSSYSGHWLTYIGRKGYSYRRMGTFSQEVQVLWCKK